MSTKALRHRREHLKEMLQTRLETLQSDVSTRMRAARRDGANRVSDDVDRSDAVIQGEVDFALIQMKGESLVRVEAALRRLAQGEYGSCAECAEDISESRLRALPFAVRCRSCEESLERRGRNRRTAGRTSLDSDVLGPQAI